MIQSITVRNFQIHKKTTVGFVPGVNIISGTSDNGKSSLIRAIRWAVENRPQGFYFKRWGAPETALTSVSLVVDGKEVARKRSQNKNEYLFEETTYKAMRSEVPEDIKEFLNLNSFNIQMQSDKMFLFQETDSAIAKMINDVSGISIIDDILKEAKRRVRGLKSEEKLLKELIIEKKGQMSSKKIFVVLKKRILSLKSKTEVLEEKEDRIALLSELIDNISELKKEKEQFQDTTELESRIQTLFEKSLVFKNKESRGEQLSEIIYELSELKKPDATQIKKAEKVLGSAIVKADRQKHLDSEYEIVVEISDSLEELKEEKKTIKKTISDFEEEIEGIKAECEMCPLCEKTW